MCDAIYIGITQQTFNKRMEGNFSDLQRLFKNGQKSDSFSAHFVQHFNNTTSRTDLHKCMTLKVIKKLNPIGVMKILKKTKYIQGYPVFTEETGAAAKNIFSQVYQIQPAAIQHQTRGYFGPIGIGNL